VLGTWLARRGRDDEALVQLTAAIDGQRTDTDRATSDVNDTIRRVAREEGLALRDTQAAMREIARDGLVGWDLMRDHCHLREPYVSAEAATLLDTAADAAGKPRLPASAPESALQADVLEQMLIGLDAMRAQVAGSRTGRYVEAIGFMVEYWARMDASAMDESVRRFLSTTRRNDVLAAIATGYRRAGLAQRADAIAPGV
jgi:hypothetical protein